MARNARTKRFTVFDVMEARGDFEENPANSISPDYKGPVQYPKMLYHPKGDEEIIVPAEDIRNSQGDIIARVGEQKQIKHRIVGNKEEERELKTEGWHDHPAKAIAASGKTPPPISAEWVINDMQQRIRDLEEELANAKRMDEQTKEIAASAAAMTTPTAVELKAPVLRKPNPMNPGVKIDEVDTTTPAA